MGYNTASGVLVIAGQSSSPVWQTVPRYAFQYAVGHRLLNFDRKAALDHINVYLAFLVAIRSVISLWFPYHLGGAHI